MKQWKTIYLLRLYETDEVDDCIVFDTIEAAYDYAYNYLIKEGYDPTNDTCGVFKELERKTVPDYFYVDQILDCYLVPYLKENS